MAASSALAAVAVATVAATLANQEPEPDASATSQDVTSTATEDAPAPPAFAAPVKADDGTVATRLSLVSARAPRLDSIPSAATAAYQRAESVMASADRSCRLGWTLLAAVGQVVSEHGQLEEGRISRKGVVRPALVGPAVRNDSGRKVTDTDAGRLDGDGRHDRAVGPMLLAPATWATVGVDGDGDGRRNPQDLDDAALAVSVLVCAGEENLRRSDELRRAVRRVNDDRKFVAAVLDVHASFERQLAMSPAPEVVVPLLPPPTLPDTAVARTAVEPKDDPTEQPSDPVTLAPPTQGSADEHGSGPKVDEPPVDDPTAPTSSATPKPTQTPTGDLASPTDDPTEDPTEEPTPTDPTCPTETEPAPTEEPTGPVDERCATPGEDTTPAP